MKGNRDLRKWFWLPYTVRIELRLKVTHPFMPASRKTSSTGSTSMGVLKSSFLPTWWEFLKLRNEKFEEMRVYKFQKLGTNECSFLVETDNKRVFICVFLVLVHLTWLPGFQLIRLHKSNLLQERVPMILYNAYYQVHESVYRLAADSFCTAEMPLM